MTTNPDNGRLVLCTCTDCNGSGYEEGFKACLICGGAGEVWLPETEAPEETRVYAQN